MPFDLKEAARREMIREGFEPDFPPAVLGEVSAMGDAGARAAMAKGGAERDLRDLLWSSIDNPESRDLDQVEVAEALPGGETKVLIGIADVDSLVKHDSATDRHAGRNTTSVYCGVTVFPMLPEQLSTGLTSLNQDADRLALVIELVVAPDGVIRSHDAYPAWLRNRAQLDYPAVGGWLEGRSPAPVKIAGSGPLQEQLRLQDRVAQALRTQRHRAGALELETIEATPVTQDGRVTDLQLHAKSRATELIEDFMIAANVSIAAFLDAAASPSIRRVVKTPERWDRIVALAVAHGARLPPEPSSEALAQFLSQRRAADPDRFPDLSLAVVKLMGPGAYTLQRVGQASQGHFGLAVHDYTHSTAPNRRFADLVTQRLLKAVFAGGAPAYRDDELERIAAQCTKMEDAARKLERTIRKQAAALLLAGRIGERFDALVTGVSPKGTFVRALHPPVEGMLTHGQQGLDVGDRVTVRLADVNPEGGFIDFTR